MQELAIQRGGKCLSKDYINIDTKLKWQCHCAYVWEAIPYSIKNGTWGPKCAKHIPPTIEHNFVMMTVKLPKIRRNICAILKRPAIHACFIHHPNGARWIPGPGKI
jgi:hypothetical protein